MRKKLSEILDLNRKNNSMLDEVYAYSMIVIILVSLVPLMYKETTPVFECIEITTAILFTIDYVCRWIVADYKLKKGKKSFLIYPFTPMAILDFLTILPVFTIWNQIFRSFSVIRVLRIFRIFKTFRYSHNIDVLVKVLKSEKSNLISVGLLAIGYVFISALLIFSLEPNTFKNFFEALYWATTALTTVGYGDFYPVTTIGRTISMISSLIGMAIIAIPSGIITAGYLAYIHKKDDDSCDNSTKN